MAMPQQLGPDAARIFAVNDGLNQLLIQQLHPDIWTARPPGKVRSIAAIFTHMHNIRVKWIRLTAPHLKPPARLDRSRCTAQQARSALALSAKRCAEMLAESLNTEGRIQTFRRDGWAQSWPVGPQMLCYMIAHEAHHRGQVSMLAHQFGHPLPMKFSSKLWNWEHPRNKQD
jgi:uncharacterized damage-inducible protein DinB